MTVSQHKLTVQQSKGKPFAKDYNVHMFIFQAVSNKDDFKTTEMLLIQS